MPIYEYKCQECDHVFEDMVLSSKDSGPEKCPKCGAPNVLRLISGTNFQLKGGGWFHSDYGKKGSAPVSTDTATASKGSGETSAPAEAATTTAVAKETKAAPSESSKAAPVASDSKPSS